MEIVKYILIGIPAAFAILSGIFKLTGNKKITEGLTKAGFGKLLPAMGLAEITFALLFIYPPTRAVGFILLVCYFSGALAVDLSHKNPVMPPLVFLALLFTAQYVSSPGFFF